MFETVTLQPIAETQPYISLFAPEVEKSNDQPSLRSLWTDQLVRLQEKADLAHSKQQPLMFLLSDQIFSLGKVDRSILSRKAG